jgi:hypothetical protein
MRKLLIILISVFIALPAVGADWINTNQATVAWDAVAYDLDTSAGETLIYKTYLANAKTDPEKVSPAFIGETAELSYQFTFTEKGSYFVGLQSVVRVDGEDVAESAIGWSDDPTFAQAGATFGLRFYPAPVAPVGMRPVIE